MIIDADELAEHAPLTADLCVVGAGPAGITLALRAAEYGAHVLLLESGGSRPNAASQQLCVGEVAASAQHPPAHMFRRRALGGSSVIWGGRCVPLDRIDFAPRHWLDLPSGWPISYDTLLPYWHQAHAAAELGGFDYSASTAISGGMRPMFASFESAAITTDSIERFSRPTDFGVVHAKQLRRHRNVRVVLHATCTNIELRPNLGGVAYLNVVSRMGSAVHVTARAYVLAAGGLELPRLLLASRSQISCGVGNASGLVGRYYMCHIAATVGRFVSAAGRTPWHGYERTEDGVYCRRRLAVAPGAQQSHRIGNVIARLHHTALADPRHRTGALSAVYLCRRLLADEYAGRHDTGDVAHATWAHLCNVATDPAGTLRFALHCARHRVIAARKFPSVAVPPRSGVFTLEVHGEQLPNADSRITLARQVDRFGVPQMHIDWRYRAQDIETVGTAIKLMAEAFVAGGHGTLGWQDAEVEACVQHAGAYGGHHLGTTRMSESPRTGVVDANCRVHSFDNLYVAGGAVFATSGQANPTLTILALALRLADHLRPRVSPSATASGRLATMA